MKVLVIITTAFVEYGGIANAFMNYYKNMNLDGMVIDVASCGKADESLREIIEKNGGRYFELPIKQKELLFYRRKLNIIIRAGYDVVDVHGNSATMFIELQIAKKNKVPNRMAHCLNSKTNHPFIHKILRVPFNYLCNNKTACTQEAGMHLYGNNCFEVLRNTVTLEEYRYSDLQREKIRTEYGIKDNERLIGTIGKMNNQKNQLFLIDVFHSLCKKQGLLKLMIVGDGPLRAEVEKKIQELNLSDSIILTGMKKDVVPYYSAFDIFAFPSIFEGESLALIEAKSSGIYGCISNLIKLSNNDDVRNVKYVELEVEKWVDLIDTQLQLLTNQNRIIDSSDAIIKLRKVGLDSVESAERLRNLYFKYSG